MINDPIADMLVRIKNAYLAKKTTVEIPYSKMKVALVKLLSAYHFVGDVKTNGTKSFTVTLVYPDGKPALTFVKRMSKPGLRRYMRLLEIAQNKQTLGYLILSTPQGLMTHIEARKKGLGGEVICKIW